VRGLSSDDCNSTSAAAEGTASTSTITLGNLDWATTEMACVQP
jgi:heat shock protein HslJ